MEAPPEEAFALCDVSNQEDNQVWNNTPEDGIRELALSPDTIRSLAGYKWLTMAIKRSIHIEISSSQAQDHRNTLLKNLESIPAAPHLSRISPMRSPALYTTDYELTWNLMRFLREQEYDSEVCPETIGRVITITGDAEVAQALSCRDYMEQMWPLTGKDLIGLLEDIIRAPEQNHTGECCSCFSQHANCEIYG